MITAFYHPDFAAPIGDHIMPIRKFGLVADGCAAALASGFHHAHADHGEGFCTFNGLVIAVDALRTKGELERAAILDLDLHYGNGTAALAASRPYITALSIYGNDYQNNVPY